MKYQFPWIEKIEDVLPHIEGKEEFIVAERENYTVINYVVAMGDTFDMHDSDDEGNYVYDWTGAMRRECRGLIFDKSGKLISRPFHKFFNVGEREETQPNKIDLSKPHVVLEKVDGSMIRPLVINGELRLATKMGVTEVAEQAERWLNAQEDADFKKDFLIICFNRGLTPLLEWVSRDNKIVIDYENADLIYLGTRVNKTGEYFFMQNPPFTTVEMHGNVNGDFSEYIAKARQQEGREGDIIRFEDGHMVKLKNDWYVRIHKVKDMIRFDRNILDLMMNEEIDDVVSIMDAADVKRIRDYEVMFWNLFANTEGRLEGLQMLAKTVYGGDKKRVALEMVPNLLNKDDGSFIFRMLDGKNVRDLLIEHVKKNMNNNTKYDGLIEWMKK